MRRGVGSPCRLRRWVSSRRIGLNVHLVGVYLNRALLRWGGEACTGSGGRAFGAISAPGGVSFPTVETPCGGGQAAVEDWFVVSPTGARRIRAAVFRLRVLEGAQRTFWSLHFAERFDVAVLRALLALGNGRGRVGFLNGPCVAEEVDGWEHSLDGIRFDVDNHRIGSFVHTGLTVRVEETGRRDCNVLGVEDGVCEVIEQVLILMGHVVDWE